MGERDPKSLLGTVVAGRYRLDDIIAMGGMGAVYRGEHVHMRKQVAIKLLHPETEKLPELVQRFERESIVGAHASHPNVASATDFGRDADGTYYLVLEYIEGLTLRQLLRRGPLDLERAIHIAKKIAAGLEAIHKLGIVHRDLGPRNVMVNGKPPDEVKLIDFGFAKVPLEKFAAEAQATALTSKGMVFGTVGFMAPEAGFGMHAVTERSDLYALGVILYEMLAGKHPFDHKDQRKLFQAHSLEPPPPPSKRSPERRIPPAIEAVILRLLEKAPEDRYPDARAFITALEAAEKEPDRAPEPAPRGEAEDARPSSAPVRRARPRGRRASDPPSRPPKRRSSLGYLLLLVVIGAGATLVLRPDLLARFGWRPEGAATNTPTPAPPASSSAVVASAPAPTAAPTATATAPHPAPRPTEIDGIDAAGWLTVLRDAANAQDSGRSAKAFEAIAAIDPSVLNDPVAVSHAASGAVVVALAGGELADETFALFEDDRLGHAGPDILYRMMTIHGGSKGAERAAALLAKEEVVARASTALKAALALRETPCAERPALFERVAAEGDERALMLLVAMNDVSCAACCLRSHPELQQAINALRERLR